MTLIILGKDITEKQITDFNQTWNTAFDKDKVILDKATINPADKIFFEYDHDILVAVARLKKDKSNLCGWSRVSRRGLGTVRCKCLRH